MEISVEVHRVALLFHCFQIELEFTNVGFCARRKTLGARMRTNNKLNPHMTPGPGFEPGPHWWEASALTTAPFLLPWMMLSYGSSVKTWTQCQKSKGAL